MNEKIPRDQLAAKIKSANNILVTVSRDPSVDQLAAALGLTFMLDKLGKHATAVFSGKIPPAINFLEPERTFEGTVDSLRDFVISLDKEKADRLRYKVEGDLVKIYITPYKTTISEKDLDFNEGDFNIELVVAIGVEQKNDLDAAITAHGRLLHDATVATILLGSGDQNAFGTINWRDAEASSLSEMTAGLVDDLSDKDNALLDEQIATVLLTGVVAATDQFRNEKTSAKVMTLAANLMAKGANQQLIASELSAAGDTSAHQGDSTEDAEPTKTTDQTLKIAKTGTAEPAKPNGHTARPPAAKTGWRQSEHNLVSKADDQIATDAETVAEEQTEDALSAAQRQLADLTDAYDSSQESPADLTKEAPTAEPEEASDAPAKTTSDDTIPDKDSSDETVPVPANPNETAPDRAESDADLATRQPVLGHAMPYAESVIGSPMSAAVAASDEPATIDPFVNSSQRSAPMINTVSPLADLPGIELPPPPPPPPPSDLGQLPPADLDSPLPLGGLPPLPPQADELTPDDQAPAKPAPPPRQADSTDPAQFQIPER